MPIDPMDLLKVHHTTVDGAGIERIIQVTPYLVITVGENPILFMKTGKVWDAGGREVPEPAPGFWKAASRANPERLRECGFDPDEVAEKAEEDIMPPPATITLPEPPRRARK